MVSSSTNVINSAEIATTITYKLTHTNFLLWKAQVIPIFREVHMYGFLHGTTKVPATKITFGTGDVAK